jgi:crotonobetainyl-CoA:carnitine CoA-transferase CaiB-like acyl-CoA transferase
MASPSTLAPGWFRPSPLRTAVPGWGHHGPPTGISSGGLHAALAHCSGRREELRLELQGIFRTRTQAEWIELFLAHDVPGSPVNRPEDLVDTRKGSRRAVQRHASPVMWTAHR